MEQPARTKSFEDATASDLREYDRVRRKPSKLAVSLIDQPFNYSRHTELFTAQRSHFVGIKPEAAIATLPVQCRFDFFERLYANQVTHR